MPTSKPTNIDAQRILAIMDELKEKLTYLSVVTGQVLEGVQGEEGGATGELLGPEVMKTIQEQIRLEELYLVANTASDGTFTQATDDNEEVREDVRLLQKNTLELCRRMRGIPNVVADLRNFQETRPGAVIQFLKTLADMQELTLKRLTTTVEEERSRQELLEHYKSHEEEASRRKQQLDKDLNHIRRERERAQTQRTEQLTKLKADLQDVRDTKEGRMIELRKRYEERMRQHQEEFNAKQEQYLKQIEQLTAANEAMRATSQEDEVNNRRQKVRREMEVDYVIKTYDKDIKEHTYNIHEHIEHEAKEQKALVELREHFAKVDMERHTIESEDAITQARHSKMEQEKKKRNDMAALVQAYFRGIGQREQYMDMKKKLRKGKGKAAGGKKKK